MATKYPDSGYPQGGFFGAIKSILDIVINFPRPWNYVLTTITCIFAAAFTALIFMAILVYAYATITIQSAADIMASNLPLFSTVLGAAIGAIAGIVITASHEAKKQAKKTLKRRK